MSRSSLGQRMWSVWSQKLCVWRAQAAPASMESFRQMLVIHIGMKKAGSASIQSFLTLNQDSLKESSIDYPVVGRSGKKDHHNLVSEIMGRAKFFPHEGTISELVEHIVGHSYETTIISSEMFEGADGDAIVKLNESLAAVGQQFRIIMIIRDMINLMPSSYAQKVRFGRSKYNFDDFFEMRIKERRVNFGETAKIWADVFGWENLRIVDLNASRPAGVDLIDDFLDAAAVKQGAAALSHMPRPGIVNAASGWRVLEAVRALHRGDHHLPDEHRLVRYMNGRDSIFNQKRIEKGAVQVGDLRGWNEDRGQYMTRTQAEVCLDIHCHSIATLNSYLPSPLAMPPDLDARGFVERSFLPEAAHIDAEDLRSFYDELGLQLKPKRNSADKNDSAT